MFNKLRHGSFAHSAIFFVAAKISEVGEMHDYFSTGIRQIGLFLTSVSIIGKHIAYSYSAQVLGVLCNFAGLVLIARMAGASGQGELGIFTGISAFLCLVLGLGLPSALVHFVASDKLQISHLPELLFRWLLLPFLLMSLVLAALYDAGQLYFFLPVFLEESIPFMAILVAYTGLLVFNQYLQALLQAEHRFRAAAITGSLGSVLLFILYCVYYAGFIPANMEALHWISGSMLGVVLLQSILYLIQLQRMARPLPMVQQKTPLPYGALLLFASTALLANLVQFLNYKMDLWFIRYFTENPAELGVYVLAVSLTQLLWLFPGAVHQVLFTHLSGSSTLAEKISRTEKSSAWLLVYGLAAGLVGYLLAPFLVQLLFGAEFRQVPALIGILLLGAIPICGALALSAFFAGIHKVKLNLSGSLVGLGVCLLGDILLIPRYGITGAAWATVSSYLATSLFYYLAFYRIKFQHRNSLTIS